MWSSVSFKMDIYLTGLLAIDEAMIVVSRIKTPVAPCDNKWSSVAQKVVVLVQFSEASTIG